MDELLLLMVQIVLRTSKKVSRNMSLCFWRWHTKRNTPVPIPPNFYHQFILKSLVEFPSSQMTEGTLGVGIPCEGFKPMEQEIVQAKGFVL